jgi:carbon monoxide dehydrogenase subunit G
MAFTIPIDLVYELEVNAPCAEVFGVLADVPGSVAYFPKVDKLTDLGDGVYQWEMERVGLPQMNIQAVYASKYTIDKARGSIVWKPVPGIGNALVGGSWKVRDNKQTTALELRIEGSLTVPLPEMMKMMVAPMAENEFERLVDKYVANLIKRFGGEV